MAGKVSSDPNIFLLPDIGEGLQEVELIQWLVAEGDTVEENQLLAEVQTDKALSEIPSPRDGTIATLHGKAGDVMKVHAPFVTYTGGSSNNASDAPSTTTPAPTEREDAGTVVGDMSGDLTGVTAAPGKVLATPAVRRIARDLGVTINTIAGTGIGGRVTEKDVRASASGAPATRTAPSVRTHPAPIIPAAAPAPPPSAGPAQQAQIPAGAETARIPIRAVRRIIAQRLRQSVDTAVHFTVMDEADASKLDALRKQIAAASGERVSFLPFVCSALCRTLTGKFGVMNATVDDDNQEIIQHRSVHMGIAVDTDNGLMVPVVRDCDRLGVLEISREIAAAAAAARDRTASREQLAGSTFTISNVGSHAGRYTTPIINYPEVAILAVGRTREGMVVKDGWFRVGTIMPLSLACDHRVVDGATAALALAEIVRLLESPEGLLTPAR